MSAPYTTDELVAAHKAALMDTVKLFQDATAPTDVSFIRQLRIAARAISICKRPRTLLASLALVADQSTYPAPADLIAVKVSDWGTARQHREPWNLPRDPLPSIRRLESAATAVLQLTPAPSADQIAAYGAAYTLYYLASHQIPDAGDTTITERDVDLLLLRAKVEAMRELAIRNHNKPVSLREGGGLGGSAGGSQSRNATAPALYDAFLREFNEAD